MDVSLGAEPASSSAMQLSARFSPAFKLTGIPLTVVHSSARPRGRYACRWAGDRLAREFLFG
jgi:hypothetical protein